MMYYPDHGVSNAWMLKFWRPLDAKRAVSRYGWLPLGLTCEPKITASCISVAANLPHAKLEIQGNSLSLPSLATSCNWCFLQLVLKISKSCTKVNASAMIEIRNYVSFVHRQVVFDNDAELKVTKKMF